jgi:hypothetical protein
MSALGFEQGNKGRLRRLLTSAIDGTSFISVEEEGGKVVLAARRNGLALHVRFLGVKSKTLPDDVPSGTVLKVRKVTEAGSLLRRIFLRSAMSQSRVTIQAGDSVIEVVCEDAEWWED